MEKPQNGEATEKYMRYISRITYYASRITHQYTNDINTINVIELSIKQTSAELTQMKTFHFALEGSQANF